jgi:uncharacterized membrane protein
MKEIDQYYKLDYTKRKRTVIVAAFVFSAAIGPFDMTSPQGSFQSRIVDLISWLAISVLAFSWCYFDSLQRNRSITRVLRLLIVIFGLIGLCIYLIISRGLKRGLISSAKALGLCAGMVLVAILSGALVTTVLDIPVPDV